MPGSAEDPGGRHKDVEERWFDVSIMEQRGSLALVPSQLSGAGGTHLTSDGTVLNVVTSGPSEAELTVVFVHGWTQDNTCWDPIVAGLPEDVRVLRHDHRGHGASAPAANGTRTLEQIADDLAEVISAHAPDGRLVLVGHSMGGMTIMALAERHPELVERRVEGITFVSTSSGEMHRITLGLKGALGRSVPRIEPFLRAMLERRKKGKLPGSPAVLSPAVRWAAFGRKARRADAIEVARQCLRAHPASVGGFIDAMFAHDRAVALGALCGKQTVVLVGDRDRLCPVSHAKIIADNLPDSEYVLFPGAGHMLMYERTEEVLTRVNAMIRKVTTAR